MKTILNASQLQHTIVRLAHQLLENSTTLVDTVFIGIQPRGVLVADQIVAALKEIATTETIYYGMLDITFYRDDVRTELHEAKKTSIDFSIEGKRVVIIDDVLYTGRTIRAALDALQDFGRPNKVELCVLVDRRFNRELPIQPDYAGIRIDTQDSDMIKIDWTSGNVILYQQD